MIEDPSLGLKVAENPEEALWTRVKEQATKAIEGLKKEILINEALAEVASTRLDAIKAR